MHIRNLFVFAFLMVGCGESHMAALMADAGPMPVMGDSGFYVWPDSGPAVTPDSGSAAPDSATPPTGGVTVVCGHRFGHEGRIEMTTGAYDVVFAMNIIPGMRPVALAHSEFDFGVSERWYYGRVNEVDTGRPYFTDWYVSTDIPFRELNTGSPVMLVPNAEATRGTVSIDTDTAIVFSVPTSLSLSTYVALTDDPRARALTGVEYSAMLSSISLVYADTGEAVPASDLTLENCDNPDADVTFIRLAQADITVDRIGADPSGTVHDGARNVAFLRLAALNDGNSDGTLDRITFDTRAVIIPAGGGERPASIRDAVSACYLTRDGSVVATGRFDGEQIVFDHANVSVTTADRGTTLDNFAYFNVECDVHLNSAVLPLYGALRVWLGADAHTGISLEEEPPARVWGTLILEQNTDPVIDALGGTDSMYVQIIR